jgi:hypothetical protein
MDADIAAAISIDWGSGGRERTVDITTTGRRDWAANLEAEPAFTLHLKNDVVADLPAHAEPVVEEGERRRIFTALLDELNQVSGTGRDLEEWVGGSPLFVVSFDD